jgi:hypothetical protein
MLKLPIPNRVHEIAQERADAMPILNGSHRGKAANEVGCMGEIIVEEVLKALEVPFEFIGATSHDLRIGNELWEVKTKERTVVPQPSYDCSVPLYNSDHQQVDRYVFLSLLQGGNKENGVKRFHTAFLLGIATRGKIHEESRVWKAGDVDPSNGTKFWTDCMNLPISKLDPFLPHFLKV